MEANNAVKTTPSVTAAQVTEAELRKEIARLQGLIQSKRPLRFQVAEKGGLSVYNLGRFPVTLYAEQWQRIIDVIDTLKEKLQKGLTEGLPDANGTIRKLALKGENA